MTLSNYPVRTDVVLKEMRFPVALLEGADLTSLDSLGFYMAVYSGRVLINYSQPSYAKLIASEIDELASESTKFADFIEFHDIGDENAAAWILSYVTPDKTIGEILEELKADWILSDAEYEKLKIQRQEYNS